MPPVGEAQHMSNALTGNNTIRNNGPHGHIITPPGPHELHKSSPKRPHEHKYIPIEMAHSPYANDALLAAVDDYYKHTLHRFS